jgi:hypothetical protein
VIAGRILSSCVSLVGVGTLLQAVTPRDFRMGETCLVLKNAILEPFARKRLCKAFPGAVRYCSYGDPVPPALSLTSITNEDGGLGTWML